ncbi:hypothetical protein FB45DRAFT_1052662 [Roridomyces roridus]|uniref:ER membrane protein complex subunit 6 n=1 Tax=Roridomyces roridus TaxID=1738132 RepID=A0AAD7FXK4_9AGAR|nr:hypothetical protein FB45DRAFT_1052662 [Roridomyces roridus]
MLMRIPLTLLSLAFLHLTLCSVAAKPGSSPPSYVANGKDKHDDRDAINIVDDPFPTSVSARATTTPPATTIPATAPSVAAGFIAPEGGPGTSRSNSDDSESAAAKYGSILLGLLGANLFLLLLGLLGANLFLLLFLAFSGLLNYLRSGRDRTGRVVNPAYIPVQLKDTKSGADAGWAVV